MIDLSEYIQSHCSSRHGNHTLDDFLDDNDFISLGKYAVKVYHECEYDITDEIDAQNIEDDLEDLIVDFTNEIGDDFGYKYPSRNNYYHTIKNLFKYIKEHWDDKDILNEKE